MGPEGSTGQMLSRNSPARANFSRFSPPSQPLSPPTLPHHPQPHPARRPGSERVTPPHPPSRGRSEHRAGPAASWSGGSPRVAGAELGAPRGRGLRGRGRGGAGAAQVGGGVSKGPAGWRPEPGGEGRTRALRRAPARGGAFLPRAHASGGSEMRGGGGAGVALLASLLWVAARCQQRGEPRFPVPGRAAAAAGQSRPLCRCFGGGAHPCSPRTGESHTWGSRAAPTKRLPGGAG